MPHRLAIICTHPIQYFAPAFRCLAARRDVEVKVFYGWEGPVTSLDHGFGRSVQWDVPLLDGYEYEFIPNRAKDPGSHHFRGIVLPTLIRRINQWRPDAVLVYGWCYQAHLQAMRYFQNRVPVLFRGDSTLLSGQSGRRGWLRRRVLTWIYRHIDIALYVGTRNRDYFLQHGIRPQQLVFAPHAVDNERFSRPGSLADGQQLRHERQIGDTDVVVLLPGKLEPVKAPELLCEACRRLAHPNCHLVFAGSGPLEDRLRELAPPRTHFLGFRNQSEMPSIYRMADLVALVSNSETWGLALNEAMACQRALLASNRVGAAVDLVQEGRNGWVFPAGDAESLTRCLNQAVCLGRDGLSQFGRESQRIVADWSIPKQVDGILSALQLVANRTYGNRTNRSTVAGSL